MYLIWLLLILTALGLIWLILKILRWASDQDTALPPGWKEGGSKQ